MKRQKRATGLLHTTLGVMLAGGAVAGFFSSWTYLSRVRVGAALDGPQLSAGASVALMRARISPEALAAAGLTEAEATALLGRVADWWAEHGTGCATACSAADSAGPALDVLQRHARSGMASEGDLATLSTTLTAYGTATSAHVAQMEAIWEAAVTFTYGTNGSFSPVSGYDTEWYSRTVVKQPDLIYKTHYFDEVGQQLSTIITDGDPGVSYTDMWATEVVRDSMGCVTEIVTPAANDNDYDHSDGSFTRKTSAGLIREYERDSGGSSATKGYINGVLFKEGDSGTAAYESWQTFNSDAALEVATGVYVIRPVVDEVRRFHFAGADEAEDDYYHATTMDHEW